jgi:hypothetical protein
MERERGETHYRARQVYKLKTDAIGFLARVTSEDEENA